MGSLSLRSHSLQELTHLQPPTQADVVAVQGLSAEGHFQRNSELQRDKLRLTPHLPTGLTAPINGKILHLVDDAMILTYKHYKGGINDVVSAISGGLAAHLFPETSGAVVGATVGGLSGATQAYFTRPHLPYVVAKAAVGALLGGMAGHVTQQLQAEYAGQAAISQESVALSSD